MKIHNRAKSILLAVMLLVVAAAAAFGLYVNHYYRANDYAQAALVSDAAVSVSHIGDDWVFVPQEAQAGFIFYPGGKVECTAYAPLLHELAENGILCVLVKMPCNLAVLDVNAADGVAVRYPEIDRWYIGGHSLGGAMAASYADRHADELEGLVLLAAYSTADLADSGLRVFTAYGSEDGVLSREKYEANYSNLPADTIEWIIEGGCHAGFGAYGAQKGDGTPRISADEQTQQAADAIAAWIFSAC